MAATTKKATGEATLLVTQTRSAIGTKPKHRARCGPWACAASVSPTNFRIAPKSGACWPVCRI